MRGVVVAAGGLMRVKAIDQRLDQDFQEVLIKACLYASLEFLAHWTQNSFLWVSPVQFGRCSFGNVLAFDGVESVPDSPIV